MTHQLLGCPKSYNLSSCQEKRKGKKKKKSKRGHIFICICSLKSRGVKLVICSASLGEEIFYVSHVLITARWSGIFKTSAELSPLSYSIDLRICPVLRKNASSSVCTTNLSTGKESMAQNICRCIRCFWMK